MTDATMLDAETFKQAARRQWDRAAAGWDAHASQIRTWLRPATDAMLGMAGLAPGMRVLDVAAGAGDSSLDAARRVGPQGSVLATDLSPAILALAEANACRAGVANLRILVADGERLPVEPATFDAAICRLGLMLFPAPLQGLREMHRALEPGGRACTVVFSRPERNPCITLLMATALRHAGLPPRDPFQPGGLLSLGKPGLIDTLFREAGFAEVTTTTIDAPFRLPTARHYLDFVRTSASPIQQILGGLSPAAAAAAWDDMAQRLQVHATAAGWEGPNELLVTAGVR
jgi:ubiquinone/menaquinone biosynthesis C-methylase UbiE